MPVLTKLSVTEVQQLRQEATNFDEHANEVKKVTDRMLELVGSTNSFWRGEAREAYNKQFQGLSDDMNFIYEMCHEYNTDLIEIAKNYETAENTAKEIAQSQAADANLV